MTEKVKKTWKSCIKNKKFQSDAFLADGDKFPSIQRRLFMSDTDKLIWSSIYYGWLVGKYGNDWEIEQNKFL